MATTWNNLRRCSFCGKQRHKDETQRIRRPHKMVWICLHCIEDKRVPREMLMEKRERAHKPRVASKGRSVRCVNSHHYDCVMKGCTCTCHIEERADDTTH
jgi:hypothetical protein